MHKPMDQKTEMKSRFDEDGYVTVTPLYSDQEIAILNAEIERFIRDVVPGMPIEKVYYEDKADNSSLKQIQKMFEYDDHFENLMFNGPERKIAETVLGEPVVPVNMQYFNKPAGIGKPTPPHQDGHYFCLTPCKAVTGWLALEAVNDENGCIHYVRGSHKATDFREHAKTGVLGFSQGIVDFGTEDDEANTVSFPGPAGTFLMHDAKTVHWAGANTSNTRSRRALGFIYYAESAKLDVAARDAYQRNLDRSLLASGAI